MLQEVAALGIATEMHGIVIHTLLAIILHPLLLSIRVANKHTLTSMSAQAAMSPLTLITPLGEQLSHTTRTFCMPGRVPFTTTVWSNLP